MTAKSALRDSDLSEDESAAAKWQEAHRSAAAAGESHYRDPATGLLVFTEVGLRRRGRCCGSGCRHCPYHHEEVDLGERGKRAQRPAWLADPAPLADQAVDTLFWSGGKDSLLAYRRLLREGARPVVLLTTFSNATRRVAHQEVHIDSVIRQAEALGMPLLGVPLHAGTPYVEHIAAALELVPRVARIVFGDLHLEHIRHWRATALADLARARGAKLHFPLWGASYEALIADLETSGVPCRVSAVTESVAGAVEVGDPFGRELMGRLPEGVDAFGENGEFHTLAKVWKVSPDETGGVPVPSIHPNPRHPSRQVKRGLAAATTKGHARMRLGKTTRARPSGPTTLGSLTLAMLLFGAGACATSGRTVETGDVGMGSAEVRAAPIADATEALASRDAPAPGLFVDPPTPDPRVGLAPGMFDAGEAVWNLRLLSTTPPEDPFVGTTNSDLAFTGHYAIQGNYNGVQIWDISDPTDPVSVVTYYCPASQNDVSVHGDLLFVSGEGLGGRLDCGDEPIEEAVSDERLRGIRIFDISDIANPEYIANVQTCRGSHTHTVLEHPGDDDNIYIYVSGRAPVRPAEELPGCSGASPEEDPNTALFRIEVIRVPLADPKSAAIVSSPRIFDGLEAPPRHGPSPADDEEAAEREAEIEAARARGAFVVDLGGGAVVAPDQLTGAMLDSVIAERGGEGDATAADSAAVRKALAAMAARDSDGAAAGPTQCHDITVYAAIGLAGGACYGYGLLLDISDPVSPTRIAEVADSNFAHWHSATFNNDGSKLLFSDEWGGGGGPRCRDGDPREWGANAIFTIEDGKLRFQSYYKLPAPQSALENCVAHNGSLIPVPGRDVMVQGWYQGGISIFDWTDPANPVEIAYHDRGPIDPDRMRMAGSWSVYWYNGVIVNSEIARGLDIFELLPSEALTQNEIDAAKSVQLSRLNAQGQPVFEWPATFALARAYLDQLERGQGADLRVIELARERLDAAERESGAARGATLLEVAQALAVAMPDASDPDKVGALAEALRRLGEGG